MESMRNTLNEARRAPKILSKNPNFKNFTNFKSISAYKRANIHTAAKIIIKDMRFKIVPLVTCKYSCMNLARVMPYQEARAIPNTSPSKEQSSLTNPVNNPLKANKTIIAIMIKSKYPMLNPAVKIKMQHNLIDQLNKMRDILPKNPSKNLNKILIRYLKRFPPSILLSIVFVLPLYFNHIVINQSILTNDVVNIFDSSFKSILSTILLSILSLISLYIFLHIDRKYAFLFGFSSSLMWLYWIALSFRFYGGIVAGIAVIFGISLFYGMVFKFTFKFKIFRIILLLYSSYLGLFGFNYFMSEALISTSIFKVDKLTLFILIVAILLFKLSRFRLIVVVILLFICIDFNFLRVHDVPNFSHIKIMQTQTQQGLRSSQTQEMINFHLNAIKHTIKEGNKNLIIFPESAFFTLLNKQQGLIKTLKELSYDINIIVGSLFVDEGGEIYNSAYLFSNGIMQVIHKKILVPFGEYYPALLTPIVKLVLGSGFKPSFVVPSDHRWDFILNDGSKLRMAICYEGNFNEAYYDSPKEIILISNNAWFYPSVEPTLQYMLLKYYARKFNSFILHSSNYSRSMIIAPSLRINATEIPAINPANKSSSITPKPPLTLLSMRPINDGLSMSKNLKNTKANNISMKPSNNQLKTGST